MRATTKEDFSSRAQAIHGERYGYSNVTKANYRDLISISCGIHGDFSQKVACHLRGRGCPACGLQSRSDKRRLDNENFSGRASEIHDGFYLYDDVAYKNMSTPVKITCPSHGSFMQSPTSHLSGSGCPACGVIKARNYHQYTIEEFMFRAKHVHEDKYLYDKTDYLSSKEKVCITCPTHGDFFQAPAQHLSGYGCSSCRSTGFNPSKNGYLYLLKSLDCSLLKIGISHDIKQRFRTLAAKTPFSFTVEFASFMSGHEAIRLEREILGKFMSAEFTGFNGATEWLRYDEDIIRYFNEPTTSLLTP